MKPTATKSSKSLYKALAETKPSIEEDRLLLNHMQITHIGSKVPEKYRKIQKLYLSYNEIESLAGIEAFENLTHLSLSYNKLLDIANLQCIKTLSTLEGLSVRGNFIELHPNYKAIIVNTCHNLQILDGVKVGDMVREQVQTGVELEEKIIPFFSKILTALERMQILRKILATTVELGRKGEIDIRHYADVLNRYFVVENATKLMKKEEEKSVRIIISLIEALNEMGEGEFIEHTETEAQDLRKRLFSELLARLIKKGERSLELYLNLRIIRSNKELKEILFSKLGADSHRLSFNEKLVSAAEFMINDQTLNRDKIFDEQEKHFFELCSGPDAFPVFPLNNKYIRGLLEALGFHLNNLHKAYVDCKELIFKNWPEATEWLYSKPVVQHEKVSNKLFDPKKIRTFLQRSNSRGKVKILPALPDKKYEYSIQKIQRMYSSIMRRIHNECVNAISEVGAYKKAEITKANKLNELLTTLFYRKCFNKMKRHYEQLRCIENTIERNHDEKLVRRAFDGIIKYSIESKKTIHQYRRSRETKIAQSCLSALRSHASFAQTSRRVDQEITSRFQSKLLQKYFVEWQRAYHRILTKRQAHVWQMARNSHNIPEETLSFRDHSFIKIANTNPTRKLESLLDDGPSTIIPLEITQEKPTLKMSLCERHNEICSCHNSFTMWAESVSFSKYNAVLKAELKKECTICSRPSVPPRLAKTFMGATIRDQKLSETILDRQKTYDNEEILLV